MTTTAVAVLPRRDMTDCPPAVMAPLFALLREAITPIDLDTLLGAVGALDVTPESLGDAIHIDTERYVRTLVFESAHVAVFVMAWLPGQRSPIHDHAGSACAVRVVSGHAIEQKFEPNPDGTVSPAGAPYPVEAGSVTGSFDNDIHTFGNAVDAPASPRDILVTIHAYSPPLAPTRKYVLSARP
jgi:cysteine dioxygenase